MKNTILIILVFIASTQIALSYEYKGREYDIDFPENIEHYEYCYYSQKCEVPEKYHKVIYLNWFLIRNGYNPIW